MKTLEVTLPGLHEGQRLVESQRRRFNVLACGRRWGKTKYSTRRMCKAALDGLAWGYFAPNYKYLTEVFDECATRLAAVAHVKRTERRIETLTKGLIEFWTLDDEDAGRSRKYHGVDIDEAGFVRDLEKRWHDSIRPTLADYRGEAWFLGTPKGRNFFHTAYQLGQDPGETDWASWQMPTTTNPFIPKDEIEAAQRQLPDRSFRQEFLAEFIEDAGGVFLRVRDAVDKGRAANEEPRPGQVYVLGVDLAKVNDFTVLTVVDGEGRQVCFERFNQISYELQAERVNSVARKYRAKTVVDATGVGDPVYDRLRSMGLDVEPFKFTSESKSAVVENLAMRIEQGRVSLMDVAVQTAELEAFEYSLTPGGTVRTGAPEGMHDDCVMALALACKQMSYRRNEPPKVVKAGGFY